MVYKKTANKISAQHDVLKRRSEPAPRTSNSTIIDDVSGSRKSITDAIQSDHVSVALRLSQCHRFVLPLDFCPIRLSTGYGEGAAQVFC